MTKSNEQNNTNVEKVVVPNLQIMLRRALLHKALPETKHKFTGDGNGENFVLKEDAECVVATIMEVMAAKRNNDFIYVGSTPYRVCEYTTIGEGTVKCMNWNGVSYFSDIDDEREARSFVKVEIPKYVKDEGATGEVVSPTKFAQLIAAYNQTNGKVDDAKIKTGASVDKTYIPFSKFNYLYVDGDIRQIGDTSDGYGLEFATLLEPRVTFTGLVFGKPADEETDVKILEWLI